MIYQEEKLGKCKYHVITNAAISLPDDKNLHGTKNRTNIVDTFLYTWSFVFKM